MIVESTNTVMSSSSLDLSYTKVVKFIEVCLSVMISSVLGYTVGNM